MNQLQLPRSEEQLNYLNWISNNLPIDAVIVEVGTYVGNCSLRFKNGVRKIYCIDVWDERGLTEATLMQPWQEVMDVFFKNAGNELFTNIFPLRMPGEFVAPYFKLGIDFLYIDGDHSYEGVKKDIEMWFPKVKAGGLVAGDDYGGGFVGVKQAVDEYFGNGVQIFCGNQWLTRKV